MISEDKSLTSDFFKKVFVTPYSFIPYIVEMPNGQSVHFTNPGVGLEDESFQSLMTINNWMRDMIVPEVVNILYHLFESNRELDEIKFSLNGYHPSNSKFTYMDFDVSLTLLVNSGGSIFNPLNNTTGRLTLWGNFDPSENDDLLAESGVTEKLAKQSMAGLIPLLQKVYLHGLILPFSNDKDGFRVSRNEIHHAFHSMEIHSYRDIKVHVGRESVEIPWYLNSIALYYRDSSSGEFDFKYREDLNPWHLLRSGEWNNSTAHTMAINARDYDPAIAMIESLFDVLKQNEQANLVLRMQKAMEEHPNLPRILFRERHNFVVNDLYPISTNFIEAQYINATVAKIQANHHFIEDEMDVRWIALNESYNLTKEVESSHKHLSLSM